MPRFKQKIDPPSRVGTTKLLDKNILEIILCTQQAEQGWIDTLRMLRRVHSIWNYVTRSIYPDLTDDIPGTQTSEEENSWRSAFHRERKKARVRISSLREPTDPSATPRVRNILDVFRTYPATLDIQVKAMWAFQWRISHITEKDSYELNMREDPTSSHSIPLSEGMSCAPTPTLPRTLTAKSRSTPR